MKTCTKDEQIRVVSFHINSLVDHFHGIFMAFQWKQTSNTEIRSDKLWKIFKQTIQRKIENQSKCHMSKKKQNKCQWLILIVSYLMLYKFVFERVVHTLLTIYYFYVPCNLHTLKWKCLTFLNGMQSYLAAFQLLS